jgi:cytochrome c-type biogenesis protein CcmH/NrfG
MSDLIKKANEHRYAKKDKLVKLKALTVREPTNSEYWYRLSLCLFSQKDNKGAWDALTNAKKLGSEKALVLISKILDQYKEVSPDKVDDAKKLLLG